MDNLTRRVLIQPIEICRDGDEIAERFGRTSTNEVRREDDPMELEILVVLHIPPYLYKNYTII